MPAALWNSHALAQEHVDDTSREHRKRLGQYFTPPSVAEFMASLLSPPASDAVRLLDPGAGAGILGIAAARHLLAQSDVSIMLTAFEVDPLVVGRLRSALHEAAQEAGGLLAANLIERDFLAATERSLFGDARSVFDVVIANPPYFKTSPVSAVGGGDPNEYARFMRRSAEMLDDGGQLVYIVPRSFMSGFYFRRFRSFLREQLSLERVHVFDSRRSAFKEQSVLQENVIVVYRKSHQQTSAIEISSSYGSDDMDRARSIRVPFRLIFASDKLDAPIRIPTTQEDIDILSRFADFHARLGEIGLEISTGPVVPFRSNEYLVADSNSSDGSSVPLLWLQHVTADGVVWPLSHFHKAQWIKASSPKRLQVPNQTCVLLRRFSAKEDDRRLVASVLSRGTFNGPWIGIENHLNFVYRPGGEMTIDEAQGLAHLLNSKLYDDYFRICSGNTQVGATEIRELPLPPHSEIVALGRGELSAACEPPAASGVIAP